jgi:hypothetical protein
VVETGSLKRGATYFNQGSALVVKKLLFFFSEACFFEDLGASGNSIP